MEYWVAYGTIGRINIGRYLHVSTDTYLGYDVTSFFFYSFLFFLFFFYFLQVFLQVRIFTYVQVI